MNARVIAGTLIVLAVAVGLGFVVAGSADGWADWVVFAVVICAAIGGAIAVWQREYPAQSKKRVFTRDSDSRW